MQNLAKICYFEAIFRGWDEKPRTSSSSTEEPRTREARTREGILYSSIQSNIPNQNQNPNSTQISNFLNLIC
jgi:hypothetical protein